MSKKRILISLTDKEKIEQLESWLEENVSEEEWEEFAEKSQQPDEKYVKRLSKKMRLVAVVSLGVMLILGGLAFFQMLETDKQKELLKEAQKETLLHRQVVEQLQDSIIAREKRYLNQNTSTKNTVNKD